MLLQPIQGNSCHFTYLTSVCQWCAIGMRAMCLLMYVMNSRPTSHISSLLRHSLSGQLCVTSGNDKSCIPMLDDAWPPGMIMQKHTQNGIIETKPEGTKHAMSLFFSIKIPPFVSGHTQMQAGLNEGRMSCGDVWQCIFASGYKKIGWLTVLVSKYRASQLLHVNRPARSSTFQTIMLRLALDRLPS